MNFRAGRPSPKAPAGTGHAPNPPRGRISANALPKARPFGRRNMGPDTTGPKGKSCTLRYASACTRDTSTRTAVPSGHRAADRSSSGASRRTGPPAAGRIHPRRANPTVPARARPYGRIPAAASHRVSRNRYSMFHRSPPAFGASRRAHRLRFRGSRNLVTDAQLVTSLSPRGQVPNPLASSGFRSGQAPSYRAPTSLAARRYTTPLGALGGHI